MGMKVVSLLSDVSLVLLNKDNLIVVKDIFLSELFLNESFVNSLAG